MVSQIIAIGRLGNIPRATFTAKESSARLSTGSSGSRRSRHSLEEMEKGKKSGRITQKTECLVKRTHFRANHLNCWDVAAADAHFSISDIFLGLCKTKIRPITFTRLLNIFHSS